MTPTVIVYLAGAPLLTGVLALATLFGLLTGNPLSICRAAAFVICMAGAWYLPAGPVAVGFGFTALVLAVAGVADQTVIVIRAHRHHRALVAAQIARLAAPPRSPR